VLSGKKVEREEGLSSADSVVFRADKIILRDKANKKRKGSAKNKRESLLEKGRLIGAGRPCRINPPDHDWKSEGERPR